jgi:hypothetical protein
MYKDCASVQIGTSQIPPWNVLRADRSKKASLEMCQQPSLLKSNAKDAKGPEFDRRFQDWTTSITIPWRNGISPLKDVTSDM